LEQERTKENKRIKESGAWNLVEPERIKENERIKGSGVELPKNRVESVPERVEWL
jgi:hypothetical protein